MTGLLVMIFFSVISDIAETELLLESVSSLTASNTENNTFPNDYQEFFSSARKCCPFTSLYNSTRRVCLYSSKIGNSIHQWKLEGNSKSPNSLFGSPSCGKTDVIVDHKITVEFIPEEEIWKTKEEILENFIITETICNRPECVEPRIKREVSINNRSNDLLMEEKSNNSLPKNWKSDKLEKILSGKMTGIIFYDNENFSVSFFPNGSLKIGEQVYRTNEFCIDGFEDFEYNFDLIARVCEPSVEWCGKKGECISKCCPDGESMLTKKEDPKKRVCSRSHLGFSIPKEISKSSPVGVHSGYPCGGKSKYVLKPELTSDDVWILQPNGSVWLPFLPTEIFPPSKNCLERIYAPNLNMDGLYAYLCFAEIESKGGGEVKAQDIVDGLVYPTALLISCFFMFITLVVYALLPSLHNLHGITLATHVFCLLAAFLCLALAKLLNLFREDVGCKALGFSILFTFMSALSWLNVMCFDIWWTFGRFHGRGGRGGQRVKSRKLKRYMYYSLYAWLLPLAITAITFIADKYGKHFLPYPPPGIGMKKCWFEDDGQLAALIHFLAPATLLLVADILMFVLTAVRCWRVKAEIHRMQNSDKEDVRKEGSEGIKIFGKRWWRQRYQADKERLLMNLKLFAAMGINWSFEIASWWLSRGEANSIRILPKKMWYVSDVINCLYGIFVFLVFVGKRKIMRQLWKRLKVLCIHCSCCDAEQSTCEHVRQQDSNSSKISCRQSNPSGTEGMAIDIPERKVSRLRKWFIDRGLCTRPSRNCKNKDCYLSKSNTTTTSISRNTSQLRISNIP